MNEQQRLSNDYSDLKVKYKRLQLELGAAMKNYKSDIRKLKEHFAEQAISYGKLQDEAAELRNANQSLTQRLKNMEKKISRNERYSQLLHYCINNQLPIPSHFKVY